MDQNISTNDVTRYQNKSLNTNKDLYMKLMKIYYSREGFSDKRDESLETYEH